MCYSTLASFPTCPMSEISRWWSMQIVCKILYEVYLASIHLAFGNINVFSCIFVLFNYSSLIYTVCTRRSLTILNFYLIDLIPRKGGGDQWVLLTHVRVVNLLYLGPIKGPFPKWKMNKTFTIWKTNVYLFWNSVREIHLTKHFIRILQLINMPKETVF